MREVGIVRRAGAFFFAAVLAIIAVLGAAVPAQAAGRDSLSAQVQVSKSSLPGPGMVDLELTITNNGPDVTNVKITYPESGQTVDLGDIATHDTKVHDDPRWEITESMLDTPLKFEVSWVSQDGTTRSGQTPAVTITQAAATVNVKAEAVADRLHVEEGEQVQFTFTFENTGNVDITDAYLEAPPLNGGERLGDDFSLEPGQTNTKTWKPTVNQEITVEPQYTYTVSGEEHTLTCDPITIRIGEEGQPEGGAFTISATANQNTVGIGGEVEFSIAVQNVGTTEISNVRVTNSNGDAAQLAQDSLAAGASATATQNVRFDQTQSITYTVTGTSEGAPLTAESDPIQITVDPNMAVPTPTPLDPSKIVEIDVSVVTQVTQAGPVPVDVTVRNLSDEELMNIVVSAVTGGASAGSATGTPGAGGAEGAAGLESASAGAAGAASGAQDAAAGAAQGAQAAAAGADTSADGMTAAGASLFETTALAADVPQDVTIGTIGTLPSGESQVLNGTLDIQDTTSYIFRVSAEMQDGTLVTSETSSATITLEKPAGGLEMWQWIVIILAAVIVVVIIILVMYLKKHRQEKSTRQGQPAPTHQAPVTAGRSAQQKPQRPAGAAPVRQAADAAERGPQTAPPRTKPAPLKSPPAPRKSMKSSKSAAAAQHYGDRNNF